MRLLLALLLLASVADLRLGPNLISGMDFEGGWFAVQAVLGSNGPSITADMNSCSQHEVEVPPF